MRLPRAGVTIDEARASRLIASAIDAGVNYFDTAYLYPGSEKALGKALDAAGARERVKVATKLPAMLVRSRNDIESTFAKQLARLKTGYVDFYLAHSLSSFADYERLAGMGLCEFIAAEKGRGRIRASGFSYHGNIHDFKRIIDAYPWEMCLIQLNYLDEHFQAGVAGLKYAADRGVGVVIMEPLRGGMLGDKLPAAARKIFDAHMKPVAGAYTPAELALRWVWKHPGVMCVLSGMGDERHLEDNCRAASGAGARDGETPDYQESVNGPRGGDVIDFSDAEYAAVEALRAYFNKNLRVPCTACAYCMPCPHGVDIPTCFSWYNADKGIGAKMHYFLATEGAVNNKPSKASLCKACGACEPKCPQSIAISERMKEVAAEMEKSPMRAPMKLALRLFVSRKPS